MKLKTIEERLKLACKCCWERLDREATGGYVGDLLSDVMANSASGDIWITRQVHVNVVAVAALKEHAAIVMVQGAEPDPDTIEKASREGIPVFVTGMSAFETSGRLHRLLFPDTD
ncbi:MAG TPA: serine kinase [Deltaproteobacteria bacterium]|nr:serine kinase [Deltaproteobacteria bacterium]